MDKYQVIGLLGEGSFGRVYKAKQLSDNNLVALKVICKRGRCSKELKGLRRECEIQRYLHHPNIIQMLDSFETDNEIVVITEFAHKELNSLLGKKGVLPEETVQKIVWDLVSALYYLHSHRVLHRDLKPQNILLDTKNRAKLCDFGFARNMSTGTHVLTSIKGTPLYMAPELVEEQPYDHNADLWSLGCIIYELLEGAPPFRTTSILHLIKLIRHEQIQWPTMISEDCISFLKGLLQKNPQNRLSWPEILNHSFVKGHIIVTEDTPEMPLTRPMSVNTLEVKEQQKRDHVNKKSTNPLSFRLMKTENTEEKEAQAAKNSDNPSVEKEDKLGTQMQISPELKAEEADNQDLTNNNQTIDKSLEKMSIKDNAASLAMSVEDQSVELLPKTAIIEKTETDKEDEPSDLKKSEHSSGKKIKFVEQTYKIENEEWLVFLKKTFCELRGGDLSTFSQSSMLDIIMSPLMNSTASSQVVCLIAKLFCLPLVLEVTEGRSIAPFITLYLKINLVPNLIYAIHLLFRRKTENSSNNDSNQQEKVTIKDVLELSSEDFDCLEYICLSITHFVHWNEQYAEQFCDAVETINGYSEMKALLLCSKRKLRIVVDLIATLTQVLRSRPNRHAVIDKILMCELNTPHSKSFSLVEFLRHVNPLLRERTCYFLLWLGNLSHDCMEHIWNETMKETLEALMYDSIDTVRNAAERAYETLKEKRFYSKTS